MVYSSEGVSFVPLDHESSLAPRSALAEEIFVPYEDLHRTSHVSGWHTYARESNTRDATEFSTWGGEKAEVG